MRDSMVSTYTPHASSDASTIITGSAYKTDLFENAFPPHAATEEASPEREEITRTRSRWWVTVVCMSTLT